MIAPERIWCKPSHDSWGAYGHWYQDAKGGGTTYVRADIAVRADLAPQWQDIAELPPTMERHGVYWVIVSGTENHSGHTWSRRVSGLAATENTGFNDWDVAMIAEKDHQDAGTYKVTHFMAVRNPPFPPKPTP